MDASDAPRDLQTELRVAWKRLEPSVASHLTTAVCVSQCKRLASKCVLGLMLSACDSQGEYRPLQYVTSLDRVSLRCWGDGWNV